MGTDRQAAVHLAVTLYLESYRPEELDRFEIFWLAARDDLDSLLERPSGLWGRLFGSHLAAGEPVDWQAPLILAMLGCLFGKIPLWRDPERPDVAKELKACGDQIGAHERLMTQLLPVAMHIYRLNPKESAATTLDLREYYLVRTHNSPIYEDWPPLDWEGFVQRAQKGGVPYDVLIKILGDGRGDWFVRPDRSSDRTRLTCAETRLVVTVLERGAASYGAICDVVTFDSRSPGTQKPKVRVQKIRERLPEAFERVVEPVDRFGYRVQDGLRFCLLRSALKPSTDRAASRR